ncbi:MAG: hypothetical protein ACMXYL_02905 [Candidatus Woesearchaeota archaeon]
MRNKLIIVLVVLLCSIYQYDSALALCSDTGYGFGCDSITDQDLCNEFENCLWTGICIEDLGPIECSEIETIASCNDYTSNHCAWTATQCYLKGDLTCDSIQSEEACILQPSCFWADSCLLDESFTMNCSYFYTQSLCAATDECSWDGENLYILNHTHEPISPAEGTYFDINITFYNNGSEAIYGLNISIENNTKAQIVSTTPSINNDTLMWNVSVLDADSYALFNIRYLALEDGTFNSTITASFEDRVYHDHVSIHIRPRESCQSFDNEPTCSDITDSDLCTSFGCLWSGSSCIMDEPVSIECEDITNSSMCITETTDKCYWTGEIIDTCIPVQGENLQCSDVQIQSTCLELEPRCLWDGSSCLRDEDRDPICYQIMNDYTCYATSNKCTWVDNVTAPYRLFSSFNISFTREGALTPFTIELENLNLTSPIEVYLNATFDNMNYTTSGEEWSVHNDTILWNVTILPANSTFIYGYARAGIEGTATMMLTASYQGIVRTRLQEITVQEGINPIVILEHDPVIIGGMPYHFFRNQSTIEGSVYLEYGGNWSLTLNDTEVCSGVNSTETLCSIDSNLCIECYNVTMNLLSVNTDLRENHTTLFGVYIDDTPPTIVVSDNVTVGDAFLKNAIVYLYDDYIISGVLSYVNITMPINPVSKTAFINSEHVTWFQYDEYILVPGCLSRDGSPYACNYYLAFTDESPIGIIDDRLCKPECIIEGLEGVFKPQLWNNDFQKNNNSPVLLSSLGNIIKNNESGEFSYAAYAIDYAGNSIQENIGTYEFDFIPPDFLSIEYSRSILSNASGDITINISLSEDATHIIINASEVDDTCTSILPVEDGSVSYSCDFTGIIPFETAQYAKIYLTANDSFANIASEEVVLLYHSYDTVYYDRECITANLTGLSDIIDEFKLQVDVNGTCIGTVDAQIKSWTYHYKGVITDNHIETFNSINNTLNITRPFLYLNTPFEIEYYGIPAKLTLYNLPYAMPPTGLEYESWNSSIYSSNATIILNNNISICDNTSPAIIIEELILSNNSTVNLTFTVIENNTVLRTVILEAGNNSYEHQRELDSVYGNLSCNKNEYEYECTQILVLDDGITNATVTAYDYACITPYMSIKNTTILVDTINPTLETEISDYYNSTVIIRINSSDYINFTMIIAGEPVSYMGNYSLEIIEDLGEGIYPYTITAYDIVQNTNITEGAFIVDMTPPEIIAIVPHNTTTGNITLHYEIIEEYFDRIEVSLSSDSYNNDTILYSNESTIIYHNLSDNEYSLLMIAYDMAGNKDTYETIMIVDTTPPTIYDYFNTSFTYGDYDEIWIETDAYNALLYVNNTYHSQGYRQDNIIIAPLAVPAGDYDIRWALYDEYHNNINITFTISVYKKEPNTTLSFDQAIVYPDILIIETGECYDCNITILHTDDTPDEPIIVYNASHSTILDAGNYTIIAQSSETENHTYKNTNRTLTVGRAQGSINLLLDGYTQLITNNSNVTVNATHTGGDTVSLYLDDTLITANQTVIVTLSLDDGYYTVNASTSGSRNYIPQNTTSLLLVDTITPVLNITMTNGTYHHNLTIEVNANASDIYLKNFTIIINGPEGVVDRIDRIIDTPIWNTEMVTENISHTFPTIESEGEYQAIIIAYDLAGNYALHTQYYVIDRVPPNISGNTTSISTISTYINRTFIVTDDSPVHTNIQIMWNETLYDNFTTELQEIVLYYENLSDGIYNITIASEDEAGNIGIESFYIHIDTTPPEIYFINPVILTEYEWAINISFIDEHYANGTLIIGNMSYELQNGTNIITLPPLDKNYSITINARDVLGNEQSTDYGIIMVRAQSSNLTLHPENRSSQSELPVNVRCLAEDSYGISYMTLNVTNGTITQTHTAENNSIEYDFTVSGLLDIECYATNTYGKATIVSHEYLVHQNVSAINDIIIRINKEMLTQDPSGGPVRTNLHFPREYDELNLTWETNTSTVLSNGTVIRNESSEWARITLTAEDNGIYAKRYYDILIASTENNYSVNDGIVYIWGSEIQYNSTYHEYNFNREVSYIIFDTGVLSPENYVTISNETLIRGNNHTIILEGGTILYGEHWNGLFHVFSNVDTDTYRIGRYQNLNFSIPASIMFETKHTHVDVRRYGQEFMPIEQCTIPGILNENSTVCYYAGDELVVVTTRLTDFKLYTPTAPQTTGGGGSGGGGGGSGGGASGRTPHMDTETEDITEPRPLEPTEMEEEKTDKETPILIDVPIYEPTYRMEEEDEDSQLKIVLLAFVIFAMVFIISASQLYGTYSDPLKKRLRKIYYYNITKRRKTNKKE